MREKLELIQSLFTLTERREKGVVSQIELWIRKRLYQGREQGYFFASTNSTVIER